MEGDDVNYLNFFSGTGDMWKRIFEPFLSLKKLLFPFWEKTLKWHAESSWDGRLGDGEIASYILNWGDG